MLLTALALLRVEALVHVRVQLVEKICLLDKLQLAVNLEQFLLQIPLLLDFLLQYFHPLHFKFLDLLRVHLLTVVGAILFVRLDLERD